MRLRRSCSRRIATARESLSALLMREADREMQAFDRAVMQVLSETDIDRRSL